MIDHIKRLMRRKGAYQRTFPYQSGAFVTRDAHDVMADLARFCRVNEPPVARNGQGQADPMLTGVMIGRQEVFNRIRAMVHVDDAALFNLKEDDE